MQQDPSPKATDELGSRLAMKILQHLQEEAPAVGTPLTERALAERFLVSRSPVRGALRELHESGYISRTDSGRYKVALSGSDIGAVDDPRTRDEAAYMSIAVDRLDGALPERVTENALMRRYDLTRARLAQLLRRISAEGWIRPLPGYGWQFLPVLTSLESYEDSYRFRLAIEPEALLEPAFTVDRAKIEQRRAEQQALVDGAISEVSGAELFDLNTRFHETVAACSRNDFFIESLVRVNRVRRLIEYRQALVTQRALVRCREHIALADLLLEGRVEEASAFLRDHLASVLPEKTTT